MKDLDEGEHEQVSRLIISGFSPGTYYMLGPELGRGENEGRMNREVEGPG